MNIKKFFMLLILLALANDSFAKAWIRINQVGYRPSDVKVAVIISDADIDGNFEVYRAIDGVQVYKSCGVRYNGEKWGMKSAYRLDFSSLAEEGGYFIKSNGTVSPNFRIAEDVYEGAADFMLNYMRQQRCGDNPFTGEKCHQHDGYIVDYPARNGEKIDVTGGWHDAADYLQYVTTSSTALYQMMFAYSQAKDKSIFRDRFGADGRPGSNGVADILDEIKWGLEWLMKMNPDEETMFNQIADDRDHLGFRKPQDDDVDYGWGPGNGRPVYYVTGEPQGLGKHKNRSTGKASTAAKFASSFALGAELFKDTEPDFSRNLWFKAEAAYKEAEKYPGVAQTACLRSPYFYEEDNYTDDVELAAATLYRLTSDKKWLERADYWGELEPVTPWMELGRGRHYQYYPFINIGHYLIASISDSLLSDKYAEYMRMGLQSIKNRAEGDPFMIGIPFLWCSNNLVSAAVSQCRLYNEVTGDDAFMEMEAALRDWLFGCNPWGTSMIVGYPAGADYPSEPHSAYTLIDGDLPYGGLVDGPVDINVFRTRAGAALTHDDAYKAFNKGVAVYHDDIGDYSSNEPTMDGTAGLIYYLSSLEGKSGRSVVKDNNGAIVRIEPENRKIYLVFTADSMFQGGSTILKVLKKNKIAASFFLTGNFLADAANKSIIEEIIEDGHYVGPHSDGHLLYADWTERDSSLVSRDSLLTDMAANMEKLLSFGIRPLDARWVIPPYEWYNAESVNILSAAGFRVLNYTPGTATPADYTVPGMTQYRSSQSLIDSLFEYEEKEGLDGAVILIHPGVSHLRNDKLYNRLPEIIKKLKKSGYSFDRLY